MASGARCTLTFLCAVATSACTRGPNVARVYDGALVAGHYVEARAYAAFLRACIADSAGSSAEAIVGFREALRLDPDASDAITAAGVVRCRLEPCPSDPATAPKQSPRSAFVATVDDPGRMWLAAEGWALAHDDPALRVAALAALARLGPARRDAAARVAEDLAGGGAIGPAQSLAAAAADASDEPLSADHGVAARLAVDEAIAQGDPSIVRKRATRGRLSLEEAAARALLGGEREIARSLALSETLADPRAFGARLVLAGAGGSDVMGLRDTPPAGSLPISGAAWVAYGEALQHVVTLQSARSLLASLSHDPILAGDDRVVRAAVDLTARGLIAPEALPSTGAVELAVVYDGAFKERARNIAVDASSLDARHLYLALARTAPSDPHTRDLGDRLHELSTDDPIVSAAAALVDLAVHARLGLQRARALLDRDPGDALLASVALRIAELTGETETARLARAVLAFVVPAGKSPL
jgi:hypothetical protein